MDTDMEVITLIENLVYQKHLIAEHGLSMLLRGNNANILIDTGQTGNFVKNAGELKVDLRAVDYLVLTHGHYDHTGGIDHFLEINPKAKIIAHPDLFLPRMKNNIQIGLPEDLRIPNDRFLSSINIDEIIKNVFICQATDKYFPDFSGKKGFFKEKQGDLIPDTFEDEIFLTIIENGKLHLVSSCSHNGITNIAEIARQKFQLPIASIIGGFHLSSATEENLAHTIDYFNKLGVERIYTGHCTGIEKVFQLKNQCAATVKYNFTGNRIRL